MGAGQVYDSHDKLNWVPITPGSIGEELSKYACNKKKPIEALLAVLSDSSVNKWSLIHEDENNKNYADFALLKLNNNKNANIIKVWIMRDSINPKTLADISYLSVKSQLEINCSQDSYREAQTAFFSDNMGSGNVIYQYGNTVEWDPIIPESNIEVFKNKICAEMK